MCKTINLMSIVKEARNGQAIGKICEERRNSILLDEHKTVNSQRELLFLKELVNRRREMPQPVKNSINRSRSQSQLNESIPLKSRDDGSTLVSRS